MLSEKEKKELIKKTAKKQSKVVFKDKIDKNERDKNTRSTTS